MLSTISKEVIKCYFSDVLRIKWKSKFSKSMGGSGCIVSVCQIGV